MFLVMNKKIISLFFLCVLYKISIAQVSVDPLTGAAGVNIPVYTLKSGQVMLPISLSYNGSGIKLKDVEGTAGMGWQLNTGGQVARVVRGLPDDVTKDNSGYQRLGWMSSLDTAANSISGFTITNNGSTCSYYTSDINYINANFPFRNDTEPDQFYINAPGLSCQLVYDRSSGKFKPVSYQDLVISFNTDATSHLITSFTITNNQGITYVFGNNNDLTPAHNKVTQTATNGTGITYFKNKYLQYQHGITYYDTWSLLTMTDAKGNGVQLNYTNPSTSRPSADSLVLYLAGSSTAATQFRMSTIVTPYKLSTVEVFNAYSYPTNYLTFNWTASSTGQTIISSITGIGRNFQFSYSGVVYSTTGFSRYFLRSFSEPGCSTPVNYQFAYAGETKSGSSYTTVLPDSTQNKFDYWGYYSTTPSGTSRIPTVYINPSTPAYQRYTVTMGDAYDAYTLSHTSRTVDAANIAAGSLNKITIAQGGNTNIIYEPNDFYNAPSGSSFQGGGVRVKQVIDSAGIHSTNNIIRNYSYINPSTGLSSGKPISLPQYAFTIPGGTGSGLTLWTSVTALSAHDLSGEDNTIMYAYCSVSQPGAGSTLYQYSVPATYWDASAIPSCSGCTTAEWHPTTEYVGSTDCLTSYGPISNYSYSYPFIANSNYDFERGLPVKVTSYNDSGTEVNESNYSYQRSFMPTAIAAFKWEDDPSTTGAQVAKTYNKYLIYYNTSELTAKVVNKVFDSPTLTQAHSDSITYTYGSANHKLLTQQQATNSDGSIVTSKINYSKDYTAASGTNANVTAIYNLQQQNINIPIESYQQVTRAGVTKTTSAGLTLFKGVAPGSTTLYLPWRQYKLVQPDGLTAFAPMTISGQVLNYDSTHYVRVANYNTYDKTGLPLTVDDNFKHIGTTLINHWANQPIAVFSNAAYGEVAYSDFDSDQTSPAYGFTINGTGSYTPVGSHAGNAAGLASSQTVTTSSSLTKNAVAANYNFSIWINTTTAGTLTLTLTGISTHPTISYTTGGWKYYEVHVPVSTLSSVYTVSFTVSTSISMDDILFYPDVAQATTATYDPTTYYKIASTNTNGVSAYYTNDQWGRLLFAYDQDHNIVQKNTFITATDASTYSNPATSGNTNISNTTPTSFSVTGPNPCAAAGTTISWDFGDGTKVSSAGLISPTHTYFGSAAYTVKDTIHSPLFGTYIPAPLSVTVSPMLIPITYSNFTTSGGNITGVTFTPVGSGTSYSFTGSNLAGAHVLQGSYTVVVVLSGGTKYNASTGAGYGAVVLSTNSGVVACGNWVSSNSYSFSMVLSNVTSLDFQVSQYDCSHFPIL